MKKRIFNLHKYGIFIFFILETNSVFGLTPPTATPNISLRALAEQEIKKELSFENPMVISFKDGNVQDHQILLVRIIGKEGLDFYLFEKTPEGPKLWFLDTLTFNNDKAWDDEFDFVKDPKLKGRHLDFCISVAANSPNDYFCYLPGKGARKVLACPGAHWTVEDGCPGMYSRIIPREKGKLTVRLTNVNCSKNEEKNDYDLTERTHDFEFEWDEVKSKYVALKQALSKKEFADLNKVFSRRGSPKEGYEADGLRVLDPGEWSKTISSDVSVKLKGEGQSVVLNSRDAFLADFRITIKFQMKWKKEFSKSVEEHRKMYPFGRWGVFQLVNERDLTIQKSGGDYKYWRNPAEIAVGLDRANLMFNKDLGIKDLNNQWFVLTLSREGGWLGVVLDTTDGRSVLDYNDRGVGELEQDSDPLYFAIVDHAQLEPVDLIIGQICIETKE